MSQKTSATTLTIAMGLLLATVANTAGAADPTFPDPVRKVVAAHEALRGIPGAVVWHDYGSFALYRISSTSLESLPAELLSKVEAADMDRILFDAYPFNTQTERLRIPADLRADDPSGAGLHLIQFVGPIKEEWLEAVRATGSETVHYVANNAYLLWTDAAGRAALDEMAAARDTVQYSAPHQPFFKLGPKIRERLERKSRPNDEVMRVVVQMYRHPNRQPTERRIAELATSRLTAWQPVLRYQNVEVTLRFGDVAELARRADVTWIGERLPRELFDEVQGQIMAGNFNVDQSGPSAPGYLPFLSGFGFSTDPADYPIVDVTDDGIGTGNVNSGDSTLHEDGSLGNPTRLAYVANCTAAADGGSVGGHGHINVAIAGGYDTRGGFPFQDPNGYQRGLGVNPWGRFAGTRIFAPGFDLSNCGGTDTGLIQSNQDSGAGISTNSWGCSGCAGSYDDSSQAFDVGVRDADLSEPGNQELIFVFSAGNSGSSGGTIGTPGNGKNMITVGASENDRPSDEDGPWTDGCAVSPTGADDAMDVIGFSSRGPAPGGRAKPELIAPGTHIQGTASTNAGYDGSSVCDQYRPSGQTVFASSSGTSHSTPAVAGLASLVYYWIENDLATNTRLGTGAAPSPALMKAYLIAHPTYLTGVSAGDTLPSNSQGYGMPNMGLLFDDTIKFIHDQSQVFDNTGEEWSLVGSIADPAKPVRIVMTYTDEAGPVGTSPQVNDLNLEATVDGMEYLGNVFSGQWSTTGGSADSANNYEAIFLPAGTGGGFEIRVIGFNVAGDGVPNTGDSTDQDFAVVCYNCAQEPTFTLAATPNNQQICTPSDAVYAVDVGSVLGFTDPVDLSVTGEPAGTTAAFTTDPVTPPGTSTLTIGNTGAAADGSYSLELTGVSGAITQMREVGLDVFTGLPGQVVLTSPADGEMNVATQPSFTWQAAPGGGTYAIEIATDAGMSNIVDSATGIPGTGYTTALDLDTNTVHYWRVRATNACGQDAYSTIFSFVTVPAPGDCNLGVTPAEVFADDLESGAPGWSSSGTGDTWALASGQVHSGVFAYHADDVDEVSDQYLDSPSIVLPTGEAPLTLQFWNYQEIEDSGTGCFDGAVAEISTDGGMNWIRLEAELLTDPYDGPVSTSFSNPLAGENAWCGDPQDWLESIVDLDAFAGDTVQFRFRLATDSSVSHPGWWIDDVEVQSCPSDEIFADGFESGDTTAW